MTTTTTTQAALFIVLTAENFDLFAARKKRIEYRRIGPMFNRETCRPGRAVTLARGYTSAPRLLGIVHSVKTFKATKGKGLDTYGAGADMIAISIADLRRG
jgi:hypothetical protein